MLQFDVVIVGGGLVGAAVAHALANSSLKVAVFDQKPADTLYDSRLDNRGLALSYTSKQLLAKIKVWNDLAATAHIMHSVHVSRQGKFGFTKLMASKLGLPALGYVVSASDLGRALIQKIPNQIKVYRPINIRTFCYDTQKKLWQVITDAGNFTAKLLVGADGTNSTVRSRLGIQNIITTSEHAALVANVEVEQGITTAFERFTPLGVLAVLPFGERRVKSVFTAKKSIIESMVRQGTLTYQKYINNLFGMRIGKFLNLSEPIMFPIQEVKASSISAPGSVLLGNAANTLHPVAAQGFNLGLRDAMVLAELLHSTDISQVPEIYAKRRMADHTTTRDFTNRIIQCPGVLQSIGIIAAQFIPAVNQTYTRRGLGSWI